MEPDGLVSAGAAGQSDGDPLLESRFVRPLLAQLQSWHLQASAGLRRRPLIGLNGPVGAGKTTLGRRLEQLARPSGLRLVVASIDDVYLSWPERGERLAGNPFAVTRVPPGSHDLPLLLHALHNWRADGLLRLPRFDKTMAGGAGDRAGWREQPCDALVLEGWLIGCRPLSRTALQSCTTEAGQTAWIAAQREGKGPDGSNGAPDLTPQERDWLPRWNRELEAYQPLWQELDGLWVLRPEHWGLPRRWRFQAEGRQRRAGGGWLPPHQLEQLVRSSLCSLPPQLYQDPLLAGLPMDPLFSGSGDEQQTRVSGPMAEGNARWKAQAPGQAEVNRQGPGSGSDSRPQQDRAGACHGGSQPAVQAVAWLDGRRRCTRVLLQASPSSSVSATG